MIRFSCPLCGQQMQAAEEHAGRQTRCPAGGHIVTIPGVTAETPRPRRDEVSDERRRRDEDDRDRRRDDEDDDRYDVRRRGADGDWMPCPNCGAERAERVKYTWWGGVIGPAIINVVRCRRCRTSYNGVHGDYNGGRIALYTVVTLLISLSVFFLIILAL